MKLMLKLTFKDEKAVHMVVPSESLKEVFEKLKDGQMYFNEETGTGFWTQLSEALHVIVQPYEAQNDQGQGDSSDEEVPGDESQDREEDS